MSETKENQHILQSPWTATYDYQDLTNNNSSQAIKKYEQNILKIVDIESLETLKGFLNEMPLLKKWPINSNIQVFRKGIKPMWEDEFNRGGEKIVFQVADSQDKHRKNLTEQEKQKIEEQEVYIQNLWNKMVFFCLSEQDKEMIKYDENDNTNKINGCIFSKRDGYVRINVWIREKDADMILPAIKEYLNFDGYCYVKGLEQPQRTQNSHGNYRRNNERRKN